MNVDLKLISDIKEDGVFVHVLVNCDEGITPLFVQVENQQHGFFRYFGRWVCCFKSSLGDGRKVMKVFLETKDQVMVLEREIYVLEGVVVPLRGEDVDFSYRIITEHVVQPGETLWSIANRYRVRVGDLILINRLSDPNRLFAGQRLKIGRVSPKESPVTVVVNVFTSKLAVYYDEKLLRVYPVALGRSDATPVGKYWIIQKEIDPALYWFGEYIPPRIPLNGLGTRYLQLSNPTYAIHGTSKPWEIGKRISHGCIRMFNRDVEELDAFVGIGTEVLVVNFEGMFPERLSDLARR